MDTCIEDHIASVSQRCLPHEVPRRLQMTERSGDIKGEGRAMQLIDQSPWTDDLIWWSSKAEHKLLCKYPVSPYSTRSFVTRIGRVTALRSVIKYFRLCSSLVITGCLPQGIITGYLWCLPSRCTGCLPKTTIIPPWCLRGQNQKASHMSTSGKGVPDDGGHMGGINRYPLMLYQQ